MRTCTSTHTLPRYFPFVLLLLRSRTFSVCCFSSLSLSFFLSFSLSFYLSFSCIPPRLFLFLSLYMSPYVSLSFSLPPFRLPLSLLSLSLNSASVFPFFPPSHPPNLHTHLLFISRISLSLLIFCLFFPLSPGPPPSLPWSPSLSVILSPTFARKCGLAGSILSRPFIETVVV